MILEPVQNAGGCFTPPEGYFQRMREICDEYDVLMISDEVICSWGRLGEWFGAQRYDYQPDIITTAKGLTSAYAPMGAVIASDRVAEPFMEGLHSFTHGFTFGGHPICAAMAHGEPRRVRARGRARQRARERRPPSATMLESLRDMPIVGDVRGAGYFQAIELVKDQETKESFSDEESETLLRGFLSGELYRRGLICRADDRGDPVIQLSPPLIAGPEQFEEIESVLRAVLDGGGRADARPHPRGRRSPATRGVMLSVRELLRDLEVRLLAGESGIDLPVRWVHISELLDPTPWLSGGELLLTTGMQLDTRRAGSASSSPAWPTITWLGSGFGTGFSHDEVPEAMLEAAAERDFPVFEVPYELPFIAVTEAAFTRLVNEQYAVLRRALAAHERLERIVLSERGLDALVGALATLIGGRGAGVRRPRRAARPALLPARARSRLTLESLRAEVRERARRREARRSCPRCRRAIRALALPVSADGAPQNGAPRGAAARGLAGRDQGRRAAV